MIDTEEYTYDDLMLKYPPSGYYLASMEIDNLKSGTQSNYVQVLERTGETNKFGREIYAEESKWYILSSPFRYKEAKNPYKK